MTTHSTGPMDAELLKRLIAAVDSETRNALLPVVGCAVLRGRPLIPDLPPDLDENVYGEVQSDWIDDQLHRFLPYQAELESLDDARFSACQAAWPDGFQWVVFNDGNHDAKNAQELIEPYLEWADRFGLPTLTEFGATTDEHMAYLTREFIKMIRQWQETIVQHMELSRHP